MGSATNYTPSLACTGNSVPLSGNTLTIAAADVGASITCTETNTPTPATLTVSKSSTPATASTVLPGQTITYTLTFTNTGDGTATVDKTDTLGAGATQASNPVASPGLIVTPSTTNPFTVTGTVGPHATSTVTYTATVNADATGTILNFVLNPGVTPPSTCVRPTRPALRTRSRRRS